MARILLPPTASDSEQTRSFRTHASYIRAFRELALGEEIAEPESAVVRLHASAASILYRQPVPPRPYDREQLFGCLRRAWATARLLEHTHELAGDSEIIRLANSWGAVQAYYVLYGCAQALMVAEGGARPQAHEPTKRRYVDLWTSRTMQLAPWTLAAAAPGTRLADADGFLSGPGRPLDLELHPWVSWQSEQAWDIAAKALRSTRQILVDDRLSHKRRELLSAKKKAWRADREVRLVSGRPPVPEPKSARLSAAQKEEVTSATRPVTMADYLYRLRIKANYEDVTMFSNGPTADHEASAVGSDLIALVCATLLVHELRIAALVGRKELIKAMDSALLYGAADSAGSLAQRRDLHAGL
ncbi:hypothetical protein [Streptomyces sp. NPDC057325]|uniref:hypothetical protein n=1 Tax=unclassified Streptomyces TaxID=2593676 RepID=UPI00363542B2